MTRWRRWTFYALGSALAVVLWRTAHEADTLTIVQAAVAYVLSFVLFLTDGEW